MIANSDMTVFHRAYDAASDRDILYCFHLHGVFWDEARAVGVIKSGLENADAVSVMIGFDVDADGLSYAEPGMWTPDAGAWTMQPGDTAVRHLVSASTEAEIRALPYPAYTITKVDAKDFGSDAVQHWEVGLK